MPWTNYSLAPGQPVNAAFLRSKLCHLAHGKRYTVVADALTEVGYYAAVAERDLKTGTSRIFATTARFFRHAAALSVEWQTEFNEPQLRECPEAVFNALTPLAAHQAKARQWRDVVRQRIEASRPVWPDWLKPQPSKKHDHRQGWLFARKADAAPRRGPRASLHKIVAEASNVTIR
ncbi:hypothetical protein [Sabulicella rubraurantiaca]|uniref:hypothetical protein n=1 Tax=Sabulicella rubraurantiaca TaxID=2811429 RepID=UPI001A975641|nr:hypothetical protein [Sabulicella rubraurantiaca]